MSLSKPLSYESLKRVLEHMEPDQRFQVARHCPSIRSVEKLVPLKLRTLHLGELKLKMNDTTYELRSYRKYPEGATVPNLHQNDEDRYLCLDKYGVEVSYAGILTPGDIDFDEFRETNASLSDQQKIKLYLEDIEKCERKLATWKASGPFDKIGAGERILEDIRVRLQPFLNRRDDILPEYEVVAQLIVSSPQSKQVENIKTNLPLYEIMKKLTTFFFGGRRDSIEINHLYFSRYIQTALRLPLKVQFKIRELTASARKLDVCEPIIDARSYPLERLVERDCANVFDFHIEGRHPLELTAKKRIICEFSDFQFSTLPNREVHIQERFFMDENLAEFFENFCRQWKNQEIGTQFSFQIEKRSVMRLMDTLFRASEEFGGIRSGERLIRVPLNHFSEIQLTFESIDNITVPRDNFDYADMGSHQDDDADRAKMTMLIELDAVWREIFLSSSYGYKEESNIEVDEEEGNIEVNEEEDNIEVDEEDVESDNSGDDVEMGDESSEDSNDFEMESDDCTSGVLIIKVVAI